MNEPFEPGLSADQRVNELDLGALREALVRKQPWIWWPTLIAFIGVSLFVWIVKPSYTAEAQVLLESQESYLPHASPTDAAPSPMPFDAESVGSQVELVTSRDIIRQAVDKLQLVGNPEFDPAAGGIGPLSRALILFGLKADPTSETPADRVVDTFARRLTVFSPTKTRVLTVEFSAHSPRLAARAANEIVALYLKTQSDAKRDRAKAAAAALATQITELRGKLTAAAVAVERYRASTGLLAGSNNMTITTQQLADLNSELSKARTAQADAQAKADLVREMIRDHRLTDIADVANNDLVRRIAERGIAAKAQLAFESRTLLPEHPRIKELKAQIADLDQQLKAAVAKTARSLENNARIAAARVANLETALNQQKGSVERANADQVHLNELQRLAQALRDQLDASMAKYQEAEAREASPVTPADARMITRAVPPDQPSFPKKGPMVIFGTLAAFVLSVAVVISSELLASPAVPPRGPIKQRRLVAEEPKSQRASTPFFERLRSLRRRGTDMRREPPLVPSPASGAPVVSSEEQLSATEPKVKGEGAKAGPADKKAAGGARIVAVPIEADEATSAVLIAFARNLTQEGRPIIIDIGARKNQFAAFNRSGSEPKGRENRLGLTDLLKGHASFAEVIQRDPVSRLHFINFGQAETFDPADLDHVLEALGQTYDFILLAAPPLTAQGVTRPLASRADFVVLVAAGKAGTEKSEKARRDLIAVGAKEVLVIGSKSKNDALVLDVA